MTELPRTRISRRSVLAAGGSAALAAGILGVLPDSAEASDTRPVARGALPVKRMQEILQADGTVSNGVLDVEINRSDLRITGPAGVPFEDGFQIQHEFFFQSIGHGTAMLNGDVALQPSETQRIIDGLHRLGLVFQAFHQHLYNLSPMVWFIHLRATGDPLDLARRAHALVKLTPTPLPQHSPPHPTTPLPAKRLGDILGGDATIGENGIVTVTVPRKHAITLGGHRISPELGVSTSVQFQPLANGGQAAVVPDFSMTSSEVNPVIHTMRDQDWEIGCLYNQEIAEHPQLYFSHTFKRGNAIELAHQVRRGLAHTDV
jgi:hypothetical protein